jgi:hypothetical protein
MFAISCLLPPFGALGCNKDKAPSNVTGNQNQQLKPGWGRISHLDGEKGRHHNVANDNDDKIKWEDRRLDTAPDNS